MNTNCFYIFAIYLISVIIVSIRLYRRGESHCEIAFIPILNTIVALIIAIKCLANGMREFINLIRKKL